MHKILFVVALLGMTCQQASAQVERCQATAYQEELDKAYPALKMIRDQANQVLANLAASAPELRTQAVVTIPVVFHVFYANATQNIPNARIYEQLDVLNKDYSRTNLDAINTRLVFLPVAVNTQIQFCLAQRTPQNAATNGIVRISSPTFPSNPHAVSPEWDHTKYLNIYVGDLGTGVLGYSNLPPGTIGFDHVVVNYTTVGGPNFPGTYVPYHLGRTATHEIGHWLNLFHTFEGGCAGNNANNCASLGDLVCDTPPQASNTWGCPPNNPNTCTEVSPFPPPYSSNVPDMYENYMDYSDDNCMNAFTAGQKFRMNDAITSMRGDLLSSDGCLPVGIEEVMDPSYMIISPNPSNGNFILNFNFNISTDVQITVFDVTGRVVGTRDLKNVMTENVPLDLTREAAGIYLVQAATSSGKLVNRVMISH